MFELNIFAALKPKIIKQTINSNIAVVIRKVFRNFFMFKKSPPD